jgi:hypothetical protein
MFDFIGFLYRSAVDVDVFALSRIPRCMPGLFAGFRETFAVARFFY